MPESFVFVRYSFVPFPSLASFVFRVFVILVSFICILYIESRSLIFGSVLVWSVRISLLIQVSIFVVVAEGFCFRLYRHTRIVRFIVYSVCHFLYLSCQLFIVSLCSFPIVIFVSVTVSFESSVSLLEINFVEYWMRVICVCDDRVSR